MDEDQLLLDSWGDLQEQFGLSGWVPQLYWPAEDALADEEPESIGRWVWRHEAEARWAMSFVLVAAFAALLLGVCGAELRRSLLRLRRQ